LVRCQNGVEESDDADNGLETYLQGCKCGADEELVFFPGAKVEDPLADHQRLKEEATDKLKEMIVM
jgi:hypothetical protein